MRIPRRTQKFDPSDPLGMNSEFSNKRRRIRFRRTLTAITALAAVGIGLWAFFGDPKPDPNKDYEAMLRNASTVRVREKVANSLLSGLMVRKYYVLADDEYAATVTGQWVTAFGDVFTLKTLDGKTLASEEEHKRRWNLSLSRCASVYDRNGNLVGYIGEEKLSDLFSISYIFHFYDANQNEIGRSKKLTNSSLGIHKLLDSQGNPDYDVNKG